MHSFSRKWVGRWKRRRVSRWSRKLAENSPAPPLQDPLLWSHLSCSNAQKFRDKMCIGLVLYSESFTKMSPKYNSEKESFTCCISVRPQWVTELPLSQEWLTPYIWQRTNALINNHHTCLGRGCGVMIADQRGCVQHKETPAGQASHLLL